MRRELSAALKCIRPRRPLFPLRRILSVARSVGLLLIPSSLSSSDVKGNALRLNENESTNAAAATAPGGLQGASKVPFLPFREFTQPGAYRFFTNLVRGGPSVRHAP